MKRFETLIKPPIISEKVKDIDLEKTSNLSPESLRFRNIERNLKISDVDGISDFSESPDGAFLSYITANKNEFKVFDKRTGLVKSLYTSSNKPGDYMINGTEKLRTYHFGNKVAIGYARNGRFVLQELSHSNQSGGVIFEAGQATMFGANYLFSKDGQIFISQASADELNFNDLESGEVKNVNLGFISSRMIDSESGSFGMVIGSRELIIFNKDKKSILKKLETKEPFMSANFLRGNTFVLSQGEKLFFYEIKDNDYQKSKELNIGFRSDKIIEAADQKHLFCHAYNFGGFFVVENETGRVVSKIESEYIQQNLRGEIVMLNKEGAVEQYNLGGSTPASKDKTQKIMIFGETLVYDKDEYSQFVNVKSETIKGLFWNVYSNFISSKLEKEGNFEWGKQRLYIEVPLSEFERVKNIVIEISSEKNIPIQFKFIDEEKSDLEIAKDKTRFVLNFRDIVDAKKFYSFLSQNESYKNILPDRTHNYYGYKLDDKTFYAFGYNEYREEDSQNLEDVKNNFTKNPDGTYTSKTPNIETGKFIVLSAEEYENLINQKNPVLISKENWEKGS